MLQRLSQRLSLILRAQPGFETFNPEIIAYGLEIILGSSFKLISIVLISILLETFTETILSLMVFASIRNFAGGAHCRTYFLCYITGVPLFIINGILAKKMVFPKILLTLIGDLILIAGLFVVMKWAPAGTDKKVVTDINTRTKMKQRTILVLLGAFLFNNTFFVLNQMSYFQAVLLGSFEALLFITPVGYKLLHAV
jgi:accessory gene regulator B